MPSAIINTERLISSCKNEAINAPIHPPVPGIGKATKAKSPHSLYFTIFSLLFFARNSKKFITVRSRVFFNTEKILFMKSKMKGMGTMLPKMQSGKANFQSIFKTLAAINPPRSSKSGTRDTKKTSASFEMPKENDFKKLANKLATKPSLTEKAKPINVLQHI